MEQKINVLGGKKQGAEKIKRTLEEQKSKEGGRIVFTSVQRHSRQTVLDNDRIRVLQNRNAKQELR